MRQTLVALAAALLLAACGGNPDAPPPAEGVKPDGPATRQVNVSSWPDHIASDTLDRFTRETGIQVAYDLYHDDATLDSRLTAGQSGHDVIFASVPLAQAQLAKGWYAKLDETLLPNLANRVPGGTHLAPYPRGGVMAIPVDAPNKAEAHAFIDFLLRPDVTSTPDNLPEP